MPLPIFDYRYDPENHIMGAGGFTYTGAAQPKERRRQPRRESQWNHRNALMLVCDAWSRYSKRMDSTRTTVILIRDEAKAGTLVCTFGKPAGLLGRSIG